MAHAEIESATPPLTLKPVFITIDTVFEDKRVESKKINLRNPSDSTWMHNHIFWCAHHNATVVIAALS